MSSGETEVEIVLQADWLIANDFTIHTSFTTEG